MTAATDTTRQVMEESSEDGEARNAAEFHKVEEGLPKHIGSRFNIPMLDNVSSYLGGHNPFAKHIDPSKEEVWLLDNTAYRPVHIYPHAPQPFQAEFVVAYFRKNTGKDWSAAVANIADEIGLGDDKGENKEDVEKIIAERLLPIVQTIAPARFMDVKFNNGTVHRLGPGGRSAISEQNIVAIEEHKDGESASISSVPSEITPHGPMLTHFAEPEGWAVISGHIPLHPPTPPSTS